MGANDAAEMLQVAQQECVRLERELAAVREQLTAARIEALEEAADELEESNHAWGKLAVINRLRARAAALRTTEKGNNQ